MRLRRHDKRRKTSAPDKGKKFTSHGAFGDKAEAVKREKEVGGFIKEKKINGETGFIVMKNKYYGSR